MPWPEVATPAPPVAETSPMATPATALPASHSPHTQPPPRCRFPLQLLPPKPLAALCYYKRQTSPPETARLVRCHNPWPAEDILFCPNDALPAFVTGIPALSSGPELWIAIHNHRPEPLQLHSGQNIGILEVVTLADAPPHSLPTWPTASASLTRASLTAPAATAEYSIPRIQRRLQPGGRRSLEYSAAGAHNRDTWAPTPPALSAT